MKSIKYLVVLLSGIINACANSHAFEDKSLDSVNENSYKSVNTPEYTISYDQSWEVFSNEDKSFPYHTSLINDDGSIVTFATARTYRDSKDNCNLSKSNLVDDKNNIISDQSSFKNNLCIIKAKENNKDIGLYQITYEATHELYTIYYEGNFNTVQKLLKNLEGSEKFKALLK